MNAVNFPRLNAYSAWFSARWIIRVVPSRRARDVVASSNSVFRLRLGRTQIWRHDLARVITHAVDDQFFNTTQARSATAGVTFVAPRIRFARNSRLNLNLVVVQSVSVAASIWIIVAAICVRTRLFEASFIVICRLCCVAFTVVYCCDDSRKFQKDFAFVFSDSNSLTASHATRTPITCDESVCMRKNPIYHIKSYQGLKLKLFANSIKHFSPIFGEEKIFKLERIERVFGMANFDGKIWEKIVRL